LLLFTIGCSSQIVDDTTLLEVSWSTNRSIRCQMMPPYIICFQSPFFVNLSYALSFSCPFFVGLLLLFLFLFLFYIYFDFPSRRCMYAYTCRSIIRVLRGERKKETRHTHHMVTYPQFSSIKCYYSLCRGYK
jgi:hypothetical protein